MFSLRIKLEDELDLPASLVVTFTVVPFTILGAAKANDCLVVRSKVSPSQERPEVKGLKLSS